MSYIIIWKWYFFLVWISTCHFSQWVNQRSEEKFLKYLTMEMIIIYYGSILLLSINSIVMEDLEMFLLTQSCRNTILFLTILVNVSMSNIHIYTLSQKMQIVQEMEDYVYKYWSFYVININWLVCVEEELLSQGYPAYTTSCGWLGYSDDKITKVDFSSNRMVDYDAI